jgi:aspartate aminotransferase
MRLSNRAKNTTVSPLRSISVPSSVSVYHLNIGQPDIESPKEFLDALKNFDSKVVAYDAARGNPELLKEWTNKLNTDYSLQLKEQDVLITSGSSEALTFLFGICCDSGDQILVPQPCYANYTGFASIMDVTLVSVDCPYTNGFHLPSIESVESKITDKTKAILICNPNNPTGTVFTRDEVSALIRVCEKHDILLIVDEVYREFVYDSAQPFCAFQLAPNSKHIVVVDSLSKRYSLCGARVGCLITQNEGLMQAAASFASTRVSSPSIEQQVAAVMMSTLPDSYLSDVVCEYQRRRDVVAKGLSQIHGAEYVVPEGGFYFLAKLPVDDATKFVSFALQQFSSNNETVFVAPANGFFIDSDDSCSYVRIAFVLSCDKLERAMELLKSSVEAYKSTSSVDV